MKVKTIMKEKIFVLKNANDCGDILIWGWHNKDVVNLADNFLENNPKVFKDAYWIKGTPVCVLIN